MHVFYKAEICGIIARITFTMPHESLPLPDRPQKSSEKSSHESQKPKNLDRKNKATEKATEQTKKNLLQLKKDFAASWKKIEKGATGAGKSLRTVASNFKEGVGKELQFEMMSEKDFQDYLLQLDRQGKLKELPTSKFVFKIELLEASRALAPKDAQKLVSGAREKYAKCLADLSRMKARGTPRQEIYMHLLTQQGGYRRSSAYVSELLMHGSGNCEARAKLMVMLLQDLYGEAIDVQLQSVNIQDSETGRVEAHTRAVVKDAFGYYTLEFPRVLYHEPSEGRNMDLYPADILKKGYLRGNGLLPDVSGKTFPVDPINTNSFLSLPTSDKVEDQHGKNVSAKDAIALRVERAKKNPSKTGNGNDDDLEIPRDVSDYAHMKILTDPDIAYDILDKVNGNSQELKLTGLMILSEECAEILTTGFKGEMLRIGTVSDGIQMTSGLATQFSKFSDSLEISLNGDLTPDIAAILAKPSSHGSKPFLGLFINGKLSPESAKILVQSREGSTYGLSFTVRDGISLETAKILNVPDRPVMLEDTVKMPPEVLQYFLHSIHPRANFTLRLAYTAPKPLMEEYWKANRPGFCLEMPDAKVCVDTSSGEKGVDTLYAYSSMTKDFVRLIRPDAERFAVHLSGRITREAVDMLCRMNKPFTLFSAKPLSLEPLQKAIGSRKMIESDHDMGEANRYRPMRYRYDFE